MKFASTALFFCVAALMALGIVMLCSASTWKPEARHLVLQPIWCGIGLVGCGLAAASDYRWLKRQSWLVWVFALCVVGLLVMVLVPGVGVKANGAIRWLRLGSLTIQPSELAKLALIVVLAFYGDHYQRFMPQFLRGFVVPSLIIGLFVGLVFKEPDVGTALLLAAVGGVMLLVAGVRWLHLMPIMLLGALALGLFLANNPMRSARIYSWLHPEETKLGKGMQTYQAMVALGSGGITGVGLGDGRQKLGFVPEHHTDFIFSVVGEELGLVATLSVMAAYLTIILCGIYIAWHAGDTFGLLLASGITFLLGFQVIINVGVVTGALPNKGLALPFISYGGSNMVVMLTAVGFLINVARHAPAIRGTSSFLSFDTGAASLVAR